MPTFTDIFAVLKRSGHSESFDVFFAEYVRRPTDKLEPDTFKKYKACLDHLNHFKKEITFQDLTPELVEDFYRYEKMGSIKSFRLGGTARYIWSDIIEDLKKILGYLGK